MRMSFVLPQILSFYGFGLSCKAALIYWPIIQINSQKKCPLCNHQSVKKTISLVASKDWWHQNRRLGIGAGWAIGIKGRGGWMSGESCLWFMWSHQGLFKLESLGIVFAQPQPSPTPHLMATLILVYDENNNKTVTNSILFQNCFDFPTDVDTSESAKDLMKRLICSAEVSSPSS